jgi:hypothetical protein
MSTSNDGVSRFQDSVIYSSPVFINGVTVNTIETSEIIAPGPNYTLALDAEHVQMGSAISANRYIDVNTDGVTQLDFHCLNGAPLGDVILQASPSAPVATGAGTLFCSGKLNVTSSVTSASLVCPTITNVGDTTVNTPNFIINGTGSSFTFGSGAQPLLDFNVDSAIDYDVRLAVNRPAGAIVGGGQLFLSCGEGLFVNQSQSTFVIGGDYDATSIPLCGRFVHRAGVAIATVFLPFPAPDGLYFTASNASANLFNFQSRDGAGALQTIFKTYGNTGAYLRDTCALGENVMMTCFSMEGFYFVTTMNPATP